MSSSKVKIVNPIRFFSFFGLFLVFLFLAFRSCSEDKAAVKYVEANKISDTENGEAQKDNTKELSEFITDIKKDLKKTGQVKEKDLSQKELAKLEDQNAKTAKRKKEAARKKKASKAKALAKIRKAVPSKKYVIVRSLNGRLSPRSRGQLKTAVAGRSFSKIMIYGYYGMSQAKGKAFIKAAEIKNTLISLGIKRSVPIYMLTEQTRLPNSMGKVVFSK